MYLRIHVEHQAEFLCTKLFVNAYGCKIGSSKIVHKSRKVRLLQKPQQFIKKKKKKSPAAKQYGKVQLLTCLSQTQILSSESITTTSPPLQNCSPPPYTDRKLPSSPPFPQRLSYLLSYPSRLGSAPAPGMRWPYWPRGDHPPAPTCNPGIAATPRPAATVPCEAS